VLGPLPKIWVHVIENSPTGPHEIVFGGVEIDHDKKPNPDVDLRDAIKAKFPKTLDALTLASWL